MSKMFLKAGFGLLVVASLTGPLAARAADKTLPGHVPAVVSRLSPVGPLAAETNLYLTLGLPLRNQEALTKLLQQIYDPASPNYRHYLTPDEFAAQFGPTTNDYQAVLDFAAAKGLTVVHTHGNRMLVDVLGKVPNVEQAFHVKMQKYQHPTEARQFYAPSAEPTVDASLPIQSVQGINNFVLPHSTLHAKPISSATSALGSGPGGTYLGRDFRNAYVPGGAMNGAGQTVGLLQFDGYFASDIQSYEAIAGLTNVPVQNVLLDGFNGVPGPNNVEVCLDIEMSIAMAPALAQVVVFEAGPYGNPDDILNSMAASNQIKQFSASWGYQLDATTPQIYEEFLLQGQTYLNASGDGDAWLGPIALNGTIIGSVESPFVTVVGGTTLNMSGRGSTYVSERAWNWGFSGDYNWNVDGYSGTSGGISTDVSIPNYQQNISMVTNGGSSTYRNVPDVALTADNVFIVANGGEELSVGGTSAASPLWAGFTALINQQAAANNLASIGFLNPILYALAQTTNYAACFHDIVAGNNTWDQSPNNYFAVPGYDLCTGLGTPNGTNLIAALTTSSTFFLSSPVGGLIPAPQQPWGNGLTNMFGSNPNGLWLLYYRDQSASYAGTNYNGWAVNLTTANPVGQSADNDISDNTFINSVNFGSATNVTALPGSLWHTTVAVTNWGPSLSSNVVVLDNLPTTVPGVTLLSSSVTIGTLASFGDNLVWYVSTNNVTTNYSGGLAANVLAVGNGGTLTLTFSNSFAGTYTNTATVSALTADPNPADESVTVIATVAAVPPILVPNLFAHGGKGFQLSVTNNSGSEVVIQASTNLVTWLPIYSNAAAFFTFTNFDSTNYPWRFYRAVAEQ